MPTNPEARSEINSKPQSNLVLGSIFMVIAFLANTLQSAFAKAIAAEVSVETFTWLTFLIALLIVLPLIILRRGRDLRTQVFKFHLLRGLSGLTAFYCFIFAVKLINLVNANVLLNTTPIFIPLIALIFLKQRVIPSLWWAIAVGFMGMIIVVKPDASIMGRPGDLLGLAAGIVAAFEFLTVKHLDRSESPLTQLFYFLVIGSVLSTPLALSHFTNLDLQSWLFMLASAVALVSFQFLLIKAYTYAKPHEIGIFQYSSVVFASLIGWVSFGEVLDLSTTIGIALICFGGILTILLQRPA
ncbi:MAG: DMT family transporter, partial [Microcystaceae cyanobacterium]